MVWGKETFVTADPAVRNNQILVLVLKPAPGQVTVILGKPLDLPASAFLTFRQRYSYLLTTRML